MDTSTHHIDSSDIFNFRSVELVCLEDGVLVPVAPVHPVFEDAHAERMLQVLFGVEDDPKHRKWFFIEGV